MQLFHGNHPTANKLDQLRRVFFGEKFFKNQKKNPSESREANPACAAPRSLFSPPNRRSRKQSLEAIARPRLRWHRSLVSSVAKGYCTRCDCYRFVRIRRFVRTEEEPAIVTECMGEQNTKFDSKQAKMNQSNREEAGRRCEDGWKQVMYRMKKNVGGWQDGSLRRQENVKVGEDQAALNKIASTFFVSNFPGYWHSGDLWKAVQKCGYLVDAFVPKRRDAQGVPFGFIRFVKVHSLQRLLNKLNSLVVGGRKLKVNVSRFPRGKSRSQEGGKVVNRAGSAGYVETRNAINQGGTSRWEVDQSRGRNYTSFKDVVKRGGHQEKGEKACSTMKEGEHTEVMIKGDITQKAASWLSNCLVGEMKDIETLTKCMSFIHTYGLGDCDIRYLGGLNVLLEFNSKDIADCFLRNQKVNWSVWFAWLNEWNDMYRQEYRMVWLRIMGVPPRFWGSEVFSAIA
ncbi:hypothetical protein LXL04_002969 [Taraxacum kok-saghyz]